MKKLIMLLLSGLLAAGSLCAATQSSVTQYGMSFIFDKPYEVGTFANGDFWVLGPVTIVRITPDFTGSANGWEVNPKVNGGHGFQNGCYGGGFQANLVPSLPYLATGTKSIVKTMPSGESRPCIKAASVLTVVESIPPDNGSSVFRPPYVGTEKPYFSINDLRTELLPQLAPVVDTPPLSWIYDRYHKVQLDHKGGGIGRALHPSDHMPNYGGDIGKDNARAILRLCLNEPVAQKMPGLIAFVQYGIDIHHMVYIGQTWPGGGGHRPGQLNPLALAALLLDDARMKNNLLPGVEEKILHESKTMFWSQKQQRALYGYFQNGSSTDRYWLKLSTDDSGAKSMRDIYDYIDGGYNPGGNYQWCCTSMPWKGEALGFMLIPQLQQIWNTKTLFDYVDRWVTFGAVTQPDPCAPPNQGGGHNSTTNMCNLDPDLEYYNSPTDFKCKAGAKCGRYPDLNGTAANTGGRNTAFLTAMWNEYRDKLPSAVLTIKTSSLPNVDEGVAYSQDLEASNGKTPYSWTVTTGSLPTGLSLSTTGKLSGTTSQTGSFNITVQVKDADGTTETKSYSIQVNADVVPRLSSVQVAGVTSIKLIFSETMDKATAEDAHKYTITPTISITSASLSDNVVTLTTGTHGGGTTYQVCVNGIKDAGPNGKTVAANSCIDYNMVVGIEIEAESGELSGPMVIMGDPAASGSGYIRTGTDKAGSVTYTFTILSAGEYAFTARVLVPNGNTAHNSFYFKLDNNPREDWHIYTLPTFWTWVDISLQGTGSATDPGIKSFKANLSAGEHTLVISGREDDTRLDAIKITPTSGGVPLDLYPLISGTLNNNLLNPIRINELRNMVNAQGWKVYDMSGGLVQDIHKGINILITDDESRPLRMLVIE